MDAVQPSNPTPAVTGEVAKPVVAPANVGILEQIELDESGEIWSDDDDYDPNTRAQMEDLYASTFKTYEPREIVTGTVISIDDREVVVNIGYKSEGVIPSSEFRDLPGLKPGDEVEIYLETLENKQGQMVVSRKMAQSKRTWERIQNAMEEDIVLEGEVIRRTKGGFVVDLEGIEAFLPGSQVDVKPVRDYDQYVGQRMEFKVVKINHQQNNVVISHKALIEKDLEAQKQAIIQNLERGQVLEGTVKNITTFGVFVDLGGVDGLLHITDISWGRISSPEEVLNLDDKINVVVLDFDDEKKRISLGYKQLQPNPWDNLPEEVFEGARIKGKVVTITEYGIFVEVIPGVEGLVHVSDFSWSQQPKNPTELFQVGQEIDAVITNIDLEDRKMSLGIKQLTEDPWNNVAAKYPIGSKHDIRVLNLTNYGLFCELEEGVEGLILVQDLSWSKKINHPSEFTQRDARMEAVVLELDVENRRIRLGVKQLTEDPWDTFEQVFPVGSNHEGTVTKLSDKGALVELNYGTEGFVPARQLRVEEGKEPIKEGGTYPFVVTEFDRDAKRIVLSHTRTWQPDEELEAKPAKKARKGTGGGGDATYTPQVEKETLGDLAALAQLKADMLKGPETPKAKSKAKAKPETSPEEAQTTEDVAESTATPEAPEAPEPKAEVPADVETPNEAAQIAESTPEAKAPEQDAEADDKPEA